MSKAPERIWVTGEQPCPEWEGWWHISPPSTSGMTEYVRADYPIWLAQRTRIEELEAQVEGCLAVIATERDEVLALRRKLAEAVQGLEDALEVGMAYSDDRLGYDGAIYLLNRLKGEQDD